MTTKETFMSGLLLLLSSACSFLLVWIAVGSTWFISRSTMTTAIDLHNDINEPPEV